jgi:hypothetical protein
LSKNRGLVFGERELGVRESRKAEEGALVKESLGEKIL